MENDLLIDLSHTIEAGMITYKGLPGPIICDYLSREASREIYAPGTEFQIGRIDLVANTGTYLDTPFHRFENGPDLAQLNLEQLANLEGILIRVDGLQIKAIDVNYFENLAVRGKAVLVHTGWDQFWRTDTYFENSPYLTEVAAQFLVQAGAVLVGIDSHNIDDTSKNTRPVHTTLLQNNVVIVEHLCNLHQLPASGFTFSAIPPKIKGLGTFPVRAFATLQQ
jgi:kynurenine formamidase